MPPRNPRGREHRTVTEPPGTAQNTPQRLRSHHRPRTRAAVQMGTPRPVSEDTPCGGRGGVGAGAGRGGLETTMALPRPCLTPGGSPQNAVHPGSVPRATPGRKGLCRD